MSSATFTPVDLSQLPPPNIVEPLSAETIFQEMLADLQTRDPSFSALVESDPAYKILQVCAYRELIIRQRVNDAARGVMLAYANGTELDHLGALLGVKRLVSTTFNSLLTVTGTTPAIVAPLIQCDVEPIYQTPVFSSDGNKFSPSSGAWQMVILDGVWRVIFFEDGVEVGSISSALFYPGPGLPPLTPHELDWSEGNATGDASGVPTTTVSVLDPTVITEADTEFRRRIQLSLEGLSVAGPRGAYIFHALSASAEVIDAHAVSPHPGEVVVYIMTKTGNGEASPALCNAVRNHLNDESIRPLTDSVTVASATVVPYEINASIYIFPGPDSTPIIDAANAALAKYIASVRKIGRDVTVSGIYAALHQPGVQRVVLLEPAADLTIEPSEVSFCSDINITLAGADE